MKFRIYWPCCCVRQGQDRSWHFGSPDWPKFVVRAWQWREVEIYKKRLLPMIGGVLDLALPGELRGWNWSLAWSGAGEKARRPGCNQNVISVIFIFG